MIKGALFDMDGIMFDTERLNDRIFWIQAEQTGLPVTEQLLKSMKGRNRTDCTRLMEEAFGPSWPVEEVRKEHYRLRDESLKKEGVPVKPGLFELLNHLKKEGIAIGLATSTAQSQAESMLKETGVFDYLDQVVYGNQVKQGKPAPDIYLHCASLLHLDPADCIVLEDAPNGVEAGSRAGCQVLMIPDTIEPTALQYRQTKAVLKSLTDVIDWIREQS